MALPVNRPDNEVHLNAYLADVSAASSTFVTASAKGRLRRVYSVIHNAITGADCTWSVEINDVAVSNSTVTIANSGSAAGDVDGIEFAGDINVYEGDRIEFKSAGESSTTTPTTFTAVIS